MTIKIMRQVCSAVTYNSTGFIQKQNNHALNRISQTFKQSHYKPYSLSIPLQAKPLHLEQGAHMSPKASVAYQDLCTEYYELDKPTAPPDALAYYLKHAAVAKGPILEPMCGTGRFLIPMLQQGYDVAGFDLSHQMLKFCEDKCQRLGLAASLKIASFENYSTHSNHQLVFIPSGSFSLLIEQEQVSYALSCISKYLAKGGKFIFEVDTVKSISEPQEVWKGNWIDKPDGSKIILSTFSRFDTPRKLNTILCRYELWENNRIVNTEVEDFKVRLYELNELDGLLNKHGFKVLNKSEPYSQNVLNEKSESILYECLKS